VAAVANAWVKGVVVEVAAVLLAVVPRLQQGRLAQAVFWEGFLAPHETTMKNTLPSVEVEAMAPDVEVHVEVARVAFFGGGPASSPCCCCCGCC